jgi:serine/threonine protein phosphatase PrpC
LFSSDVEEHEITENTEFFILACDGLWDKLSNEGAVEFVRERLAKKIPVSTIIKELVQDSYDKGSMDNISAILVVFTHTLKKLQQQQQQQQQQQLRKSAKDTRHVAKSETPTENQATQGHSTAKVPEHSNLSKEAVSPRKCTLKTFEQVIIFTTTKSIV